MSETGRSIVLESGMGGGDIRLPIDDGGSGSRGSSIFDPTDLDAVFPKGGCFGSGGCTPEIGGHSSGSLLDDPIARSAGLPSGDGCFGTGGVGGILDAAGDGAAGVVMDGCFDPNAGGIDLQGALGGALSSAVNSALNSLLAVNDETPAGEAIAKTLISKYKEQLLEFLHDPGGMLSKIRALFRGIESAANVPIGVAQPTGGPVVVLQQLKKNPVKGPVTRLGDNAIMTKEDDAGPFVQGNPTVIINGMPAAGKGHLAIGLSKKTPGEPHLVATSVLMGTATVTDLSVYEKAKAAAAAQKSSASTPTKKPTSPSSSGTPVKLQRDPLKGQPPGPQETKDISGIAYGLDKITLGKAGNIDIGGKSYPVSSTGEIDIDGRTYRILDINTDPTTGFKAGVIADPSGRIGIGFAGTDGATIGFGGTEVGFGGINPDIPVDIRQAMGLPVSQYEQARAYYESLQQKYPLDQIQFLTGHSLGGGLANYVGAMYGVPASGINSAPLGSYYLSQLPPGGENHIVNYNTFSDPVSQSPALVGGAIGVPYPFTHVAGGRQLGTILTTEPNGTGLPSLNQHLLESFDPSSLFFGSDGKMYAHLPDDSLQVLQ